MRVFVISHFSCVWLFATLWIVVSQAPLFMGFSRQEYWSGLPCPPPGDLLDPGIRTRISCVFCFARRFFTAERPWKPLSVYTAKWTPSGSWNLPFPILLMSQMRQLCPVFRNATFFYCYCVIGSFVFVSLIWTSCFAFLSYILLCENIMRQVRNGGRNQGWEALVWFFWTQLYQFSSVQFSHSVVSNSLRPHEPQHARPLCPSPTPGVHPNPCPLSRWCHPTISTSVVPFSSCPQSFPASGSFQMSQLLAPSGQSSGVSASKSVLPMTTQDWSPLGWTGWISLQSKGLSRVFSNTTVQKHQSLGTQLSWQSIHTWPLEKP